MIEAQPSSYRYLEEVDRVLKLGIKESDIFDAFMLFDNDIKKASEFLLAFKVH